MEKITDNSPELFSNVLKSPQISALYNDIEELTELLAIYFKQGIENGEYCVWFFPDELAAQRANNELKKSGVDVEHCIVSSQLEFQSSEKLPKNITLLKSEVQKELAEKGSEKAFSGGFAGFRTNFRSQKFRNFYKALS